MMAAIGIEKGKPFEPDARMKKILTDAAAIGNAAARAISFFPREPGNLIYGEDSAWMMAYANKDTAFTRNGAYNLDARALFHFGYICVSPAMAVTVAGKGSDYGLIALDSQDATAGRFQDLQTAPAAESAGEGLLGADAVRHPDPLAAADRPAVPDAGQPDRGREEERRRLLRHLLRTRAPKGKEGNWLQTIPGKSWWLALRMYGPLAALDRPDLAAR
jgi:hypothetical protein